MRHGVPRSCGSGGEARLRSETGVTSSSETPPEEHFPVAIVGAHGLLVVTTVVLVFLTAVGVG